MLGRHVVVGTASGIGNGIFLLPMLRKLYDMGTRLTLYAQNDYDILALWRRCRYLDAVVDAKAEPVPKADAYLAGHWCPKAMMGLPDLKWARWINEPHYPHPEWRQALVGCGLPADHLPDVSDWCRDLDRTPCWDVGIIPGSKGGIWLRKRYPAMATVAHAFLSAGHSVVWLGQGDDWDGDRPGLDLMGKIALEGLPDVLAGCRVIISTDTGPGHLASSLGVPTVMLFTGTSVVKGQPVGPRHVLLHTSLPCQPCQSTGRWHQCHDWRCQQIPPDLVVSKAIGLLC